MSDDRKKACCHCWIPVMGALLIVISIADCGLAVVLGSLAEVVHQLDRQVDSHNTGMKVAGFFHGLTGGLVNLGDSQTGVRIRSLVDELPTYWVMATLAWGRVFICILGFILGWLLVWRFRFVPFTLIAWGVFSLVWGLLSVSEARVIFRSLVIEDLTMVGVLLSCLAFLLHLLWPFYVVVRMFKGIRAGDFSR